MSIRPFLAAAALLALSAPFTAHAVGTVAGTTIQNSAQVSYTVSGSPQTTTSNVSSVTVDEIVDVVTSIASPTVTVTPGATQQELLFTVTNTGNGTETFSLAGLSTLGSDDFDPTPSSTFIYFDTDNSGDLSSPDAIYTPGLNDPVLAPDTNVRVLLVNDIPAGVLNSQRGRSQLTATSLTGVDDPGTVFPQPGGAFAVLGTSGGDSGIFGEYLVGALQLTAVKSQTIQDQFLGDRPVPGARINYQIVVTATGAGTATASVLDDPIPANTTYVAGSLRLNGSALSDAGDADAGEFTTTPAAQVRVTLGDLTQASGPQTIEFAVTID
jgi:uncharacterized repeat protein (TIGR01451 family)